MKNGIIIMKIKALLFLLMCAVVVCPHAVASPEKKASLSSSAAQNINSTSLRLNEEGVKAIQSRDFVKAETVLSGSLSQDPYNIAAAHNLAIAYISQKKFDAAVDLLKDYSRKVPADGGIKAKLGDAYFSMKRIAEAVLAYEEALKLDPALHGVSARLGTLYSLENRLVDAEKMLLSAVKEDPKNGDLVGSLSALFLANEKPNEAIGSAKRALQLKPSSEVYITLGTAYERKKDFANALIAFRRARDVSSKGPKGSKDPKLEQKIEELEAVAPKS